MPALTSQWNKGLLLRGVTGASMPSLLGKVVFESELPFRLRSLKAAPGVLTQRVVRANGTGFLSFSYQIALTETDLDTDLQLAIGFSQIGIQAQFADYWLDGPGMMPANTFDSSPQEGFVFKFNHGLSVGRASRFCFIATNAREFAETGGTLKLMTGLKSVSLDSAAPTGVAPARWSGPQKEPDNEDTERNEPVEPQDPEGDSARD